MWGQRPAHLGLPVRDERLCRTIPHQLTQGQADLWRRGPVGHVRRCLAAIGEEIVREPNAGQEIQSGTANSSPIDADLI